MKGHPFKVPARPRRRPGRVEPVGARPGAVQAGRCVVGSHTALGHDGGHRGDLARRGQGCREEPGRSMLGSADSGRAATMASLGSAAADDSRMARCTASSVSRPSSAPSPGSAPPTGRPPLGRCGGGRRPSEGVWCGREWHARSRRNRRAGRRGRPPRSSGSGEEVPRLVRPPDEGGTDDFLGHRIPLVGPRRRPVPP